MATQFHNYEGAQIEKQHRTIYIESARELSDDEARKFIDHLVDNDIDYYNPESGINVTRGSIYHSERNGTLD